MPLTVNLLRKFYSLIYKLYIELKIYLLKESLYMKRIFFIIIIFTTLNTFCYSCKKASNIDTASKVEETNDSDIKINAKDIEKLSFTEYALSDLAITKTQDWPKFQELTTQIEILKKGDLTFFQEDKTLLETFITDLKKEIPEHLNKPSILVRLNVIETTAFKLEGITELGNLDKNTVLNYIKDILISYTNLIFQINKKLEKDSQNIIKPI